MKVSMLSIKLSNEKRADPGDSSGKLNIKSGCACMQERR